MEKPTPPTALLALHVECAVENAEDGAIVMLVVKHYQHWSADSDKAHASHREEGRLVSTVSNGKVKYSPVSMEFRFGRPQPLVCAWFSLTHEHEHGSPLSSLPLIGSLNIDLAQVMTTSTASTTVPANHITKARAASDPLIATATLSGVELNRNQRIVTLHFRGRHFVRKDTFRLSLFAKRLPQERGNTPWRTIAAVVSEGGSSSRPLWPPITAELLSICHNDIDHPLKLVVSHASNRSICGTVDISLRSLIMGGDIRLSIADSNGKFAGQLEQIFFEVVPQHGFLDFLCGGMDIDSMIAIDFTASNKPCTDPKSLHAVEQGIDNSYERAINAIGDVLKYHHKGQQPKVLGFGGAIAEERVTHCFDLPLKEVEESQGEDDGMSVIDIYRSSVPRIRFAGPSVLSHIIDCAVAQAMGNDADQSIRYTVLVIITDGDICDARDVADLLVEASALPLSIIFVGVGQGPFPRLDCMGLKGKKGQMKSSTGLEVERDFTHFFRLSQDERTLSLPVLANKILNVLPDHIMSYARKENVVPLHHLEHAGLLPISKFRTTPPFELGLSSAPSWEQSSDEKICSLCKYAFTFTFRKHHCRCCARAVCGTCSPYRRPIPAYGVTEVVRVCEECMPFVQRGQL
eukprot:TRINITY_DN7530_c0_g1_i1.p1 TRINITY_DN7530_c0_g1~~TRINITY_DN7530_c0_g1_i1.p1  ORF type:complete len:632 (+),score=109.72 TRINITY_DN7530_c0_g1_i1:135-2030(+)